MAAMRVERLRSWTTQDVQRDGSRSWRRDRPGRRVAVLGKRGQAGVGDRCWVR